MGSGIKALGSGIRMLSLGFGTHPRLLGRRAMFRLMVFGFRLILRIFHLICFEGASRILLPRLPSAPFISLLVSDSQTQGLLFLIVKLRVVIQTKVED